MFSSHLRLGLPKGLFPVGLPVKILKALLPILILSESDENGNYSDEILVSGIR